MNQFIFTNVRCTKDIELKTTSTGKSVCNLVVAVDRGKDRDGKDLGAWFPKIEAWGSTAENLAKYIGKGNRINVEGRIESRTEEIGGKKITTNCLIGERFEYIDFKDSKAAATAPSATSAAPAPAPSAPAPAPAAAPEAPAEEYATNAGEDVW